MFRMLLSYMSPSKVQKCYMLHKNAFNGKLMLLVTINIYRSSHKVTNIHLNLTKYGVSQQIFVEVPNIKICRNLFSGSHIHTHG